MRYLSVCSGIEAATVAWRPLGWRAAAFSEIEKFPRAVLRHHYPDVPLHGDFTTIGAGDYGPIDLLVGGTPCQSFSVAGLRRGLDDDRGNLALEFLRLADRKRARWVVWENVPGVFSATSHDSAGPRPPDIDLAGDDGPEDGEEIVVEDCYDADENHAFSCFLAGLSELGYGWAYRVFDAQYFRLAQRRRRVFVVGYLGDWRRAAAVLFEREGLQGNPAPRRETGEGVAPTISARPTAGGGLGTDCDCDGGLVAFGGNNTAGPVDVATACNAHGGPHGRMDFESETFVAHALRGEGFDASEDGTGRGTPVVPVAFSCKDHGADAAALAPTLRAMGHGASHANAGGQVAVAIQERAVCENPAAGPDGKGWREDYAYTLEARQQVQAVAISGRDRGDDGRGYDRPPNVSIDVAGTVDTIKPERVWRPGMAVRRLTPRECERLQGFPDDYTRIPWRGKPPEACPDGPRYKALGNSMPRPVMRWLGERIGFVDALETLPAEAAE